MVGVCATDCSGFRGVRTVGIRYLLSNVGRLCRPDLIIPGVGCSESEGG
jgi:hypothetical protein